VGSTRTVVSSQLQLKCTLQDDSSLTMATNHLTDFIRKLDVIPFEKAERVDFDLLMAATIQPRLGRRGVDIVRMRAGFTADFFTELGSPDGNQDLERLIDSARIAALDPLIAIRESAEASSGHFGLSLSAMMGASGRRGASADTRYSLTNVETRSLEGSTLLVPFLEKHFRTFVKNVPTLRFTFKAKPTWWSGSIDKVVAIVVTTVTGTAEVYQEKTRIMSGGAEAAVPLPASAATKVGIQGSFEHSSSGKKWQNERSGVLGASFCMVHLRKSFSSDDVEPLDSIIVNREHDPSFLTFLRRIKLKEFRKLLSSRAAAPLGVLTEKTSQMEEHHTLDGHVNEMKRDITETAAIKQLSLGVGGWDNDNGLVNLKIAREDSTLELHNSQRVPEGADLRQFYAGSWNFVLSAPRTYLSKMYQDLKEGKPVVVAGETVAAMSPAFTVKTSSFLPICYIGSDGEAPGAVVRDYDEDTAFIFPVDGNEKSKSCVTVYSEEWEVRESIIRLRRSNNEHNLSLLKQRGFHEIDPEVNPSMDEVKNPDEILMGRHQLAHVSDPVDDGNSIFRVQGTDTAAVVADSVSAPSLWSATQEGNPTKKHKP
jgi:hypothetical protein